MLLAPCSLLLAPCCETASRHHLIGALAPYLMHRSARYPDMQFALLNRKNLEELSVLIWLVKSFTAISTRPNPCAIRRLAPGGIQTANSCTRTAATYARLTSQSRSRLSIKHSPDNRARQKANSLPEPSHVKAFARREKNHRGPEPWRHQEKSSSPAPLRARSTRRRCRRTCPSRRTRSPPPRLKPQKLAPRSSIFTHATHKTAGPIRRRTPSRRSCK